MKKILLLCSFILIAGQSFAQDRVISQNNCYMKKSQSQYLFLPGDGDAAIIHSYDVMDYKLDLNIYNCFLSPYPKSFTGNVIITLKADSIINEIKLNAVNTSLTIDSVRLSGVSYSHTNNILTVTLDRSYNVGEILQVKIYYKHNNVTDNAFNVSGGMVFTDCEPEGARKWFPCWDRPYDKATLDLTAKVPATVKLGSNGRLEDSVHIADTIWYNWISADPIATYLMVISAKVNYGLDIIYWHKLSNPADSIPIRFYYNSGENINTVKNMMLELTNHFSTIFCEHPFEKNGFAALNNQFAWGGMENQTLTSICPGCWSEYLAVHEFAHQWFGDMITCATWADIFLNEGFATFSEALWTEHKSGYNAYLQEILSNASSYKSSNPGWAISNPQWAISTPPNNTLFNYAITYLKGSCVLHLLRYTIGDSLFFEGIKTYANDPGLKFKAATIPDFSTVMSSVSGQDLTWFFDEWIFQPNHPVYQNGYYFVNQGQTYDVGFLAKQIQTNPPFFKMPLEIKIHFSTGADTTIRVMNDQNNQLFVFTFNRQPLTFTFDPGNKLVLKEGTTSQIPPIPVELVSFTAEAKQNFVVLNWKTSTELNNKGFEVLRASLSDKENFETVSFIEGSGTTTKPISYSYVDYIPAYGRYIYKLKQIDFDGTYEFSGEIDVTAGIKPETFTLSQNYPNPFNPSTQIIFEVPKTSDITITVYNLLGEVLEIIASGTFETGIHTASFDGSRYASGIYVYELRTDNISLRNKMILQK